MNTQNPPAGPIAPIDVAEAGLRLAILDVLRRAQERSAGLVGTWPKGQALVNGQPRDVIIVLREGADPIIDTYGEDQPLRLVDRIEAIEAIVQQIVEEAQARVDSYAAAHAKIAALRAKIGGSGAAPERVTAGGRTAEMARQDPQPRDRWRLPSGSVYRVVAVDPANSDDILIVWEANEDDPAYVDNDAIGEEGAEYLGVSATLLGAP